MKFEFGLIVQFHLFNVHITCNINYYNGEEVNMRKLLYSFFTTLLCFLNYMIRSKFTLIVRMFYIVNIGGMQNIRKKYRWEILFARSTAIII